MEEERALLLLKCLADRSRLRLVASLQREPMYVELLAQRLGLSPATVSFHLKKLEEVGLVAGAKEQYYTVYSLCAPLLTQKLCDLLPSLEDDEATRREEAYRQKVLASFMKYGKLESIPVQQKKLRIILEEILKAFEKGRRYTEKEVNLLLADFNDDFCTLRRSMICEGLMERDHNIYWVREPSAETNENHEQ